MLCVTRELADGSTKKYHYSKIGGVPLNEYHRRYKRERLERERATRTTPTRAKDIPAATLSRIVQLREDEGLSWHAVAQRVGLSVYLVRKAYDSRVFNSTKVGLKTKCQPLSTKHNNKFPLSDE